ncbi:MAG: dihydroorotase [Actinomycetota bacterium]
MAGLDLLVKNAQIVTPGGTHPGSILVSGGRIVGIEARDEGFSADREIDARGRYVIPGLVDPHSHVGGKYALEQDFRTETPGAAAGGVTTVGLIHGSARATWDYKEFVTEEDVTPWSEAYPVAREIGEKTSVVDFFYLPTITVWKQVEEIPRLAEEFGFCGYKFYANLKNPETTNVGEKWKQRMGNPGTWDDGLIYAAFEQLGRIGPAGIALVHNENQEVAAIFKRQLMAKGRKDPQAWTERSPGWLEAEHVIRYGKFAREAGVRFYVLHLTSKEGVEACIQAKAEGADITVETCPHYLTLTCNDPPGHLLKVNPPIRYEEDNEALWRGIREGVITCIGTDHVVSSIHEKLERGDTADRQTDPKEDIWSTGSGCVGWDTLLPVMLSEGVHKGRITIEKLVEICCQNTAKTFGLFPKKGAIQIGADADLVILDSDKTQTMRADMLHSHCDFTWFEGRELTGWPATTLIRGQVVYDDGKVVGEHGYGQAVARKADQELYPVEGAA